MLFLFAPYAYGHSFDALNEHSLGFDAISDKRISDIQFQWDNYLVDGEVVTYPVSTTTYDRTAISQARLWGHLGLSSRLSARWSILSKAFYRKEEGASEPRQIAESEWSEHGVGLDLTFVTSTRLEVIAGAKGFYHSPYERVSRTASVETKWEVDEATLANYHLAVVKRTGFVEGGFLYRVGVQKDRAVKKYSLQQSDDLLVFNDTVHYPTMVAVFARFKMGYSYIFSEFSVINASEGGGRTDNGDTIKEDYQKIRGTYFLPFGLFSLKSTVIHKTLSYADNRTVTLDTMPMTALHLKLMMGKKSAYGFAGLIYGYGKDGQSLTEFNADYSVHAFGGSVGGAMEF